MIALLLQTIIVGLLIGTFYALVAIGFSMVWASMKVIDVSYAAMVLVAAYLTYEMDMWFHIDPLILLAIIPPIMFAVGMALYKFVISISFRSPQQEVVSLVATFGMAIVIENYLLLTFGPEHRAITPALAGVIDIGIMKVPYFFILAAVFSIGTCFLLYLLIYRTAWGRGLRATWQDPMAASFHGIDAERLRVMAYGLAISTGAVAGVFLSGLYVIHPYVHWSYIIYTFVIVIVGGVGSIIGTMVTGISVGLTITIAPLFIPAAWTPVLLYLILIIFLIVRPYGLFRGYV